ncbi:hypothetical protein Acear_1100 [Acetohalobium arabaticum DSM 5501]|uniref:Uncharacterized protein n=1 Tax=Acetohalobium arabaticum (strain ATCC 49924 / DSM 5501 / Z-7288) TaxID=574087 RepID=D9QQ32_ACEAZ|nr:hypothetical protein Acear_1100 [Acetohalobium arabaticum DSM 5501]
MENVKKSATIDINDYEFIVHLSTEDNGTARWEK